MLAALASYLPEGRLTNAELVDRFGQGDAAQISEDTGIDSRCIAADGEFTSDMAARAAEALFAQRPSYRELIDTLILVTVTPDFAMPATAPLVQHALGLGKDIAAYDISLGCSGYPYALHQVAALIESGRARKVLLITADRMTVYTSHAGQDIQTLFGDAATASLIVASDLGDPGEHDGPDVPGGGALGGVIGEGRFGSDGSGADRLWVPTSGTRGFAGQLTREVPSPTLEMNGIDVFAFTLRVVGKHVQQFLESQGLAVDDIDLFVFHQANRFMIEHLRRRLKIDEERFAVHIAKVGNTVSSTIPLALEQALADGAVKAGQRVLLVGFGVGYSWGSVLLDYSG